MKRTQLLLIGLLFLFGISTQAQTPSTQPAREIFKVVAEMPRFPGCESEDEKKIEKCAKQKMDEYIKQNLVYPKQAIAEGIEGTVVIRALVEKDGSLSGITCVRDIGGGCGAEAIRIFENMPKWRPGYQRGRTVEVQINIPVKFSLDENRKKTRKNKRRG